MKRAIIFIVSTIVLVSSFGFTYAPSIQDKTLLIKMGNLIESIDTDKLENIQSRVDTILDKSGDRMSDRIYYMLNTISITINEALREREYTAYQRQEKVTAYIDLIWSGLYARNAINGKGYGFRVGVSDEKGNAKNPILQVTVPKGFCLEYNEYYLPMSMAWYSFDNARSRRRFNVGMIDRLSGFDLMCDVTHIKVILPKDVEMFNDTGFGFGFIDSNLKSNEIPFCVEVLLSADNAQYQEEDVCFNVHPDVFLGRYSSVYMDWGLAKSEGYISTR